MQDQESSPQEPAHSPPRKGGEKKRKAKAKSLSPASEEEEREPGLKQTTRELALLEDPEKREDLKGKLNSLYEYLFPKLSAKNPLHYNKCCLSFSSRYLSKEQEHSSSETLFKVFKASDIKTKEEFVDFMIKEIEAFPTSHQFIPARNCPHDGSMKRIGSSLEQAS